MPVNAPIKAPEVAARAVVEAPRAVDPARARTEAFAARVRAEMNKNPRSASEQMARPPGVEQTSIDRALENNFGVDRDPTTGKKKRGGNDYENRAEGRRNQAEKRLQLAKKLEVHGYDTTKLSRDEVDLLTNTITSEIKKLPGGQELWEDLHRSGDAPKAIINILKDKDYVIEVQKMLAGATEEGSLLDASKLKATKEAFENAAVERDKIKAELDVKDADLTNLDTESAKYTEDPTAGTKGAKVAELETAKTERPMLTAEIKMKQGALKEMQAELDQMKQDRTVAQTKGTANEGEANRLGPLVLKKQQEVDALASEIAEQKGKLDSLITEGQFKQQKAEIETKRKALKIDAEKQRIDFRKAETKALDLQADYGAAQIDHEAAEKAYAEKVNNIFADAAKEHFTQKIQAAEASADALAAEEAANDPMELAIADAIKNRWDKYDASKKKTGFKKPQIEKDWRKLVDPRSGPGNLMQEILLEAGYTPEQIGEKMADKEFMAKMQPKLAERLVTRRLQTGNVSYEEARYITESDWGEGMIKAAMANREKIMGDQDALREIGKLGGVREWLKKGGNAWKLLALVLGGATIIAAPALIMGAPLLAGAGVGATAAMGAGWKGMSELQKTEY